MEIKVSVIVPVYKVESFIGRCAQTLMEQSLAEVEYIFVDDATPDRSMEVLEQVLQRYPQRRSAVRILHHDANQGLPAARNTGLEAATGEYVFHCDSDDFLEKEMLERMYAKARETGADFVWCDWFLSYRQTERRMVQPALDTPEAAVKGMLADAMKFNVWNKLVRRSLYTDYGVRFPAGHSMGEDMTMIRLAAVARKVAYVPGSFYHYVKTNAEAMTQHLNERHLADLQHNVSETLAFLQQRFGDGLQQERAFFQLNVKLPFLITDDWDSYRRWTAWWPEANAYIWQNRRLPWRTRALQTLAAWKCYAGVWIYYMLLYKCLYRLLYR